MEETSRNISWGRTIYREIQEFINKENGDKRDTETSEICR
jgi:hypothetical protein